MTREFTAESLVVLPMLNVDSGLALWQALRAGVAVEKKLPKFFQQAWQNVEVTGAALHQAAQTRLTESSTKAPPKEKRKADSVVDNAMGSLEQWLAAWARLPDMTPEGAACRGDAPDAVSGWHRVSQAALRTGVGAGRPPGCDDQD